MDYDQLVKRLRVTDTTQPAGLSRMLTLWVAATRRQATEATKEPIVYEVTQLINSLLGLLVLPRERVYQRVPAVSLRSLESKGWPHIDFEINQRRCRNLKDLLEVLRNAVAHFNIEI